MSRDITDPAEMEVELARWYDRQVTAYVRLNPHVEMALKSKLDRLSDGTWRVCFGTTSAASALLFSTQGIRRVIVTEQNALQIAIDLSLPGDGLTAEFV